MKPSDGAAGPRRGLSARLILTLILSISALIQFTVVSRTTVEIPFRVDAGDYFSYAYNLSHHGVYSIRYDKTKTAGQLGITFRALRYKLKKLDME
jgi:hypothetical protein